MTRWVQAMGLLLLLATSSSAQVLKDPSTFTCDKWVGVRATDRSPTNGFAIGVTAWMQGYFAGVANLSLLLGTRLPDVPDEKLAKFREDLRAAFSAPSRMLDAEGIPAFLDAYCPTHPTEPMGTVALRLLKDRVAPSSPPK